MTIPKRAVMEQARTFQAKVLLIEDTAAGTAIIQELRARSQAGVPGPIAIRPEGDKVMRLATQTHLIEAGQVLFPRQAPWLDAFQMELFAFPHSTHDDQVDSVSQFLNWVDDYWDRQRRPKTKWILPY